LHFRQYTIGVRRMCFRQTPQGKMTFRQAGQTAGCSSKQERIRSPQIGQGC